MSWKLTGLVSQKRIGGSSRRLLLLSMADKANDDGSGVYASFATLADMSEMSRPTVKRLAKEFLEEGLIFHVGERACRNGKTNDYSLNVEAIRALPDVSEKTIGATTNPVHHEPGSAAQLSVNPVQPDPTTRVTMTPKPILKPKSLTLTTFELETLPVEKAKGKKRAKPTTAYTPEFNKVWLSWPRRGRDRSDKRKAFERYLTGVEQFGVDAVERAAARYLLLPDTRKENYQFCCAVEVFMNGKLEAAVEAALEETPRESVTHEQAEHGAAKRYHDKTGRWPQGYRPPMEARQ